jgi:hypothetical protein
MSPTTWITQIIQNIIENDLEPEWEQDCGV